LDRLYAQFRATLRRRAQLRNAREHYLLTVFAMANLGPTQAARHLSNGVTPHQLSYSNQRHMA
jgi:hypothetical protein